MDYFSTLLGHFLLPFEWLSSIGLLASRLLRLAIGKYSPKQSKLSAVEHQRDLQGEDTLKLFNLQEQQQQSSVSSKQTEQEEAVKDLLSGSAEMKKVRFSDEDESDTDGEVAALVGIEFENEAKGKDAVASQTEINERIDKGPAAETGSRPQQNGRSEAVLRLKAQLREKDERICSLTESLKQFEEGDSQPSKLDIEQAQSKIDALEKENLEKEAAIEDLRLGLSNALEFASKSTANGNSNEKEEEWTRKLAAFESDIVKLEQKLLNANEEKEYYKKHYNSGRDGNSGPDNTCSNSVNGSINDRDDFGRELMLANKRKYQLEGKVRQLEQEYREAQNKVQHLDMALKNSERYLWLEKERSATLEQERNSLKEEMGWLKRDNDQLKQQLEASTADKENDNDNEAETEEVQGGSKKPIPISAHKDHLAKEIDRLHKDYGIKISDILALKSQLEWKLGEVTKNWNDAKWRVGELEATMAHKEYLLDQSGNRIKQLESVLATPMTNMSEEISWLREEVCRLGEEKSGVEWKLGEMTQVWNDAKWRIGELEGELMHKNHLLQNQHHSRQVDDLRQELEHIRHEKDHLEWRLSESDKAFNDAKWRVGELEGELRHKNEHIHGLESSGGSLGNFNELHKELDELRDQKSKVEWRLGEVVQYWNDAKWRVGDLQEQVIQKENHLREVLSKLDHFSQNQSSNNDLVVPAGVMPLLGGSFVVHKQPNANRHWNNMATWDNILAHNGQIRRVWFEVDAEGASNIFLVGSFLNWECALVLNRLPDNPNKFGMWIDIPIGRHEFRFIKDGQWYTASNYAKEYNEYGGMNNWLNAE